MNETIKSNSTIRAILLTTEILALTHPESYVETFGDWSRIQGPPSRLKNVVSPFTEYQIESEGRIILPRYAAFEGPTVFECSKEIPGLNWVESSFIDMRAGNLLTTKLEKKDVWNKSLKNTLAEAIEGRCLFLDFTSDKSLSEKIEPIVNEAFEHMSRTTLQTHSMWIQVRDMVETKLINDEIKAPLVPPRIVPLMFVAIFLVSDVHVMANKISAFTRVLDSNVEMITLDDKFLLWFSFDSIYSGVVLGEFPVPGIRHGCLDSINLLFIEDHAAVESVSSQFTEDAVCSISSDLITVEFLKVLRDFSKHFIHLRQSDIVSLTLQSLRANVSSLLGKLPSGQTVETSMRGNRLANLITIYENLIILRQSQLLIEEWIRKKLPVIEPSHLFQEQIEPKLENQLRARIDNELNIQTIQDNENELENRLAILEQTIQGRIGIERTAVEISRQEHEGRIQRTMNILTIVLAFMVVFEVIATYLAWRLPIDFSLAPIIWTGMFIAMFIAIGLLLGIALIKIKEKL